MHRFQYPRWINKFLPLAGGALVVVGAYGASMFLLASDPQTLNVGHAPKQPVPFSHKVHVGQLKMDCRYCHTTVEKAAHAAIPPTATCANCHSGQDASGSVAYAAVHSESLKLEPVRESIATGEPIPWQRVHDLADFAYFDHSAHVTRGVSCVSCHGRVDRMDVVTQVEPLTMSWCLDCHRNPDPHIRPLDKVTDLEWVAPEDPAVLGARLREEHNIHPSTNCSTCHR